MTFGTLVLRKGSDDESWVFRLPETLGDPDSLTDLSDDPNGPKRRMASRGRPQRRQSSERVDCKVTGRQSAEGLHEGGS